jgi:hypothetical protein
MLVHASSKVFIFLLFGFLIDISRGVRDLRRMGGFFFSSSLLNLGVVGIFFLSSLPFFPLAALKDRLAISLASGGYVHDVSLLLLLIATTANYLYMFRLFLKIFFGDSLGYRGTYLNFFAVVGGTGAFRYKVERGFLLLTPLLPLVMYVLFLESSVVSATSFGIASSYFGDGWSVQPYVPSAIMQYFGYSNLFFYLIVLNRLWFRVNR